MAVLMTPPYLQFFDANGAPLAGGFVYTYTATGTFSTNKATFTTEAGDVEHPNPVVLDAAGRPDTGNGSIWLSGTYDFVVKDSGGVTIETTLDVTAFSALPSVSDAYFESFSGTGAQTAYTTSDDLGTDEKAIYVWVDAGAGDAEGYVIQNPSAYTISGTTLTFAVAPATGTNNIYVSAPSLLVGAASSAAADAAVSAAAADASEAQAGAYAGQLTIVSTTSVAIGTGSKVFTVAADLSLSAGQFILIASDASPTVNYMWGTIASYSSTTLTVTVATIGGSGTLADWTMYLTGERGTIGPTGSISDISGATSGTAVDADTFIFTDISDSNATKKAEIGTIRGSYKFVESLTASASANLEFTTDIDTNSISFMIIISDLVLSSSTTLDVQVRNVATWRGSGYTWNTDEIDAGTETINGSASAAGVTLNSGSTTLFHHAIIYVVGPADSGKETSVSYQSVYESNANAFGAGSYATAEANNGIRLIPLNGTITSGTATIYKLSAT